MTLSRALYISCLAVGVSAISIIPVDIVLRGLDALAPHALVAFSIYGPDGALDGYYSRVSANELRMLLSAFVAIAICVALKRSISLRPVLDRKFLVNIAFAVIAGTTLGLVVRFVGQHFDPGFSTANGENVPEMAKASLLLAVLFASKVCVLGPIEEEFIHRGLVMELAGPAKTWQLAAVSVLPWAFGHMLGGGLRQVGLTLLIGPVFFWVRQRSGHFGYAVVTHAIFNAIQIWQ